MHELLDLAPGGLPLDIEGAPPGGSEFGPRLTRSSIASPAMAVVEWQGFA